MRPPIRSTLIVYDNVCNFSNKEFTRQHNQCRSTCVRASASRAPQHTQTHFLLPAVFGWRTLAQCARCAVYRVSTWLTRCFITAADSVSWPGTCVGVGGIGCCFSIEAHCSHCILHTLRAHVCRHFEPPPLPGPLGAYLRPFVTPFSPQSRQPPPPSPPPLGHCFSCFPHFMYA